MIRRFFIRANNAVTRMRRIRVAPQRLLLLVPHCLQWHQCDRKVSDTVGNCERCGRCRIADIVGLCNQYGIQSHLVGGGRRALEKVRDPSVKAVVAVACEKELCDGLLAAFPKPVLAVPNCLPHGPCRDTVVDIESVRAAILGLLEF